MDVHWIASDGSVQSRPAAELSSLLRRTDGFTWVDLPEPFEGDIGALVQAFDFAPEDVAACTDRTVVPKVVARPDHVFFILHTLDDAGHLLEHDVFLGHNYLVTVHGPLTPGVPLDLALVESRATLERLGSGALGAASPDHLAHDFISGIEASIERLMFATAAKAGGLDRRAREGKTGEPEAFLEELFNVRHSLVTVRNRAAQSRQACHAISALHRAPGGQSLFQDLEQRFDRLTTICDGEREFVQGVLDYFESITNTRMNAALNRLAIISFIVLPATALIGFFGISSISYAATSLRDTLMIAGFLLLLTLVTLRWTKSKGWW